MPQIFHDALQYSAPCRLTGICSPIILMKNNVVRVFTDNPYLWGSDLSCRDRFFVRQMVASVLTSLPVFYILVYAL
ncbi:AzlD domain-containing protein [Brenneria uluponensis]|uniref:AzlD domain-containing protein n=1 Tax=Brenneria uluponensis TaxID=3057057 RepID=UPI0028E3BF37|nr:AzlD domain-containing protein [Brenneria ulupoensis]